MIENAVLLFLCGIGVGALGTLVGVGGGFLLMPLLLVLYPDSMAETLTCISLAVVFFNSLSGTLAYSRMGRVDYRSGVLFASATVPGAIMGAFSTNFFPRHVFNVIFGILLVTASVYLVIPRRKSNKISDEKSGLTIRRLIEKDGTVHEYSFKKSTGIILSLFVGYISSMLGIGGGIINVPALSNLLKFPIHIATATSQFILCIMACTGTVVHTINGAFAHGGVRRTGYLGAGALLGAQLGAELSRKIHGVWIIRILSVLLAAAGMRIIFLS